MLIATITLGGVAWLVLLVIALILAVIAFAHWISYGGIIGWWLANDMFNLIGLILQLIGQCIAAMLSND